MERSREDVITDIKALWNEPYALVLELHKIPGVTYDLVHEEFGTHIRKDVNGKMPIHFAQHGDCAYWDDEVTGSGSGWVWKLYGKVGLVMEPNSTNSSDSVKTGIHIEFNDMNELCAFLATRNGRILRFPQPPIKLDDSKGMKELYDQSEKLQMTPKEMVQQLRNEGLDLSKVARLFGMSVKKLQEIIGDE